LRLRPHCARERHEANEDFKSDHKEFFEVRGLNIDQLRTLVEVVELGSFSAAARRLNLTQPAISLQIRELESRCGLRLVERVGKTILPTAAGRDLIAHAARISAEADRALAAMRGHRDGHLGRLHLGTGPTVLAFLLHPVLQGLREHHPNLELVITTGTTGDVVERLLSNVVDLGFTALPVDAPELVAMPVRTDELVAILPASEIDIPSAITPADVDRRTLISEYQRGDRARMSRGWMKAAGFEPRPAMVFDAIEARIAAVAAGLGMGFIPRPVGNQGPSLAGTVLRPLDPPLIRTLGLVQRRNRRDDLPLRLVRDAILALANLPIEPTARPAKDP
jgi:DNA-binding transcriptional LysR family regulator